ncbi:hypothetical protein UAW_01819 [Enterococcus haemoperoxidus ATCC BAA-382]|uniref:Uncharacterized protein n=1 Tax=Enterococcus haemoperoxidus ATCC BAA-382 TaxID=1158608 RepID=R2T8U2_9ENTE|nr:hypothetical protein [Enterococcus haemoperoxidus]EOH96654.1 hypothetical protein UAW_01819 [Enterococcus haemoperoxidus ATCC BAA-382]EOT60150.1 hypothetical protein I583_02785 [Enterococcus haemoperoxidus ATCC BAA-382]OJG51483.1 hypothetical protein RV06_GL001624 [Enterococcus haemoperoxidus]
MKRNGVILLIFVMVSCFLYSEKVEAIDKLDSTTDVSITFLKDEDNLLLPSILQPPLRQGEVTTNSHGKLPSTGDLITSVIWVLLGFSLLIVLVGVYCLKSIMAKMTWK